MSAQLEDGYTRIANELLDELPKFKFNGTQLRIIMVVWRFTYGFKRKDHEMSLTFFVKAIGMGKTQIDREITNLIVAKVLIVTEEPTYTKSRKIGFNKNYEEWKIEYSQQKEEQSAKTLTVSEYADEQSANTSTPTVSKNADQERYSFKENLKEKYTAQFEEFWKLYPEKKGKTKALTKWLLLAPKFDFEKVMQGTRNYIEFIEFGKSNGKTRDYKDGSTYVNQESWNDDWSFSGKQPINPREPRGLVLTDAYDGHNKDVIVEPYDNFPDMTDEERELNLFAYKKSG